MVSYGALFMNYQQVCSDVLAPTSGTLLATETEMIKLNS